MAPVATTTENGDLTNASSLDECVDLFYTVHDSTPKEVIKRHLRSAWRANPQYTLRLLFYLLDVRNGKSATMSALYGLQWLLQNHQNTFLVNLTYVNELGCIRDFATLLMMERCRLAQGIDFSVWQKRKVRNFKPRFDHEEFYKRVRQAPLSAGVKATNYAIVQLFVSALIDDKARMSQKKPVSLFSKWLPSQDSYLNRTTRLFDDVAMALYAKECGNAQRRPLIHARNYLRKNYISPLRKYASVTERLMSDKQWSKVAYKSVPSKCMARNSHRFEVHDGERYMRFLQDAVIGKVSVKAAVLKPHEICFPHSRSSRLHTLLADAQWEAYVSSMRAAGTLSSCVAVCDVSGSMSGQPMDVCVSLGLLIATLAKEPWKDHLITFSANPQFHLVTGKTLTEKLLNIQRMDWMMNTNFDRIFDIILDRAMQHNVKTEDVPKTIFVFSDMQFDLADPSMNSTGFQRVKAKFAKSSYEMPQIVFWNLRNSHGVPVTITDEGTALVSGFSGNLLKLFLEGGDFAKSTTNEQQSTAMSPVEIMRKAIDHERYCGLRVID